MPNSTSMTSPIQPRPNHVTLSPEFLRRHGAVEDMKWQYPASRDTEWYPYPIEAMLHERDYQLYAFSAPRSIVTAIDPEYVREWDQKQQEAQTCTCSNKHNIYGDEFPHEPHCQLSRVSEGTGQLRSDSQAPSLTAGPSSGVTVSPEGGEVDARVLAWLARHAQWDDSKQRMTVFFPMPTIHFTTLRETVLAAMQQEAGQ